MTLQTIIVDDEELARNGIRHLLQSEADVKIIAECKDGIEACDSIAELNPDLVFLDIQMPGLNGFEVISSLKMEILPYFIFVTAFDDFALQAFKVHAVDYLLKPVNPDLFHSALSRARLLIEGKKNDVFQQKLSALINETEKQQSYLKRLVVKERGRTIVVNIDDINCFTAEGDYVKIHTDNENYLYRATLNNLTEKIDPVQFCRIHRSTILRINLVKEFEPISKGDYILKTSNGHQFTLSRSYRDHFFTVLKT